jgi:hypothetical protein
VQRCNLCGFFAKNVIVFIFGQLFSSFRILMYFEITRRPVRSSLGSNKCSAPASVPIHLFQDSDLHIVINHCLLSSTLQHCMRSLSVVQPALLNTIVKKPLQ